MTSLQQHQKGTEGDLFNLNTEIIHFMRDKKETPLTPDSTQEKIQFLTLLNRRHNFTPNDVEMKVYRWSFNPPQLASEDITAWLDNNDQQLAERFSQTAINLGLAERENGFLVFNQEAREALADKNYNRGNSLSQEEPDFKRYSTRRRSQSQSQLQPGK